MYLPVEPGRLIEGPVNRGPENRGCTVYPNISRISDFSFMVEQYIEGSKYIKFEYI